MVAVNYLFSFFVLVNIIQEMLKPDPEFFQNVPNGVRRRKGFFSCGMTALDDGGYVPIGTDNAEPDGWCCLAFHLLMAIMAWVKSFRSGCSQSLELDRIEAVLQHLGSHCARTAVWISEHKECLGVIEHVRRYKACIIAQVPQVGVCDVLAVKCKFEWTKDDTKMQFDSFMCSKYRQPMLLYSSTRPEWSGRYFWSHASRAGGSTSST